jgi:hypothetical protein
MIPLFCPVCQQAMSSPLDPGQFLLHKCCDDCAVNFAEIRREEWKDGWRPSVEDARQGRPAPSNT